MAEILAAELDWLEDDPPPAQVDRHPRTPRLTPAEIRWTESRWSELAGEGLGRGDIAQRVAAEARAEPWEHP